MVGIDRFGESAPAGELFKHFGFTAAARGRSRKEHVRSEMTIKVAINGYGRIGRNVLRALYESGKKHDLQIVAINDLGDAADQRAPARSTTPRTASSRGTVEVDGDSMVVNGDRIKVFAERDPAEAAVGRARRRRRARVHRPLHHQGEGRRAPARPARRR